ncbi:hypothetical protein PF005_g29092 [Phytophthora fragariae]|nr:hypothetical protein PF003_g40238 [Phytophthora fragariae]KAE9072852.1 hypothetical protein PF007_g26025 [Phytophthora fragariae]KAE9075134.1 hypothetical protein PF006_g28392 [Phytophthora fragariae]KAE9166708.1 hypothetical protein PF005_g29092 [Phytophthora fragariae]KAE9260670.1 hypothetical protein PF001_g32653 [Phytophthora fragariae]
MQEGEREEAGRGSASRASRRVQGLPPEETKSLDGVKREARKANAAKRKAAEEKKKLAAAEEQSSSGLDVQDAHQVLLDDGRDEDLPDDMVSVFAGDEELKTPALGMPEEEVEILEDPARRLLRTKYPWLWMEFRILHSQMRKSKCFRKATLFPWIRRRWSRLRSLW